MTQNNVDQGPVVPDLLTVKQVAQRLQIGTNLVYRLANTGELPSKRLGKNVRFPRVALENYINSIGSAPRN